MGLMYEFECAECGEVWEEINVPHEERDNARQHEGCGGAAVRLMAGMKRGKAAYQMQAVITDRSERKVGHVGGHFAKDAKRKRK